MLGTAVARPIISKAQIEIAREYGAEWVSHGATGKGNDQVRFEFAYAALAPEIGVLSPWKTPEFLAKFQGRTDMINYAQEQGIPIPVSLKKPFSTDENLLHKSYESGILEDPMLQPDPTIFTMTNNLEDTADEAETLEIEFKDGRPLKVTNLNDKTSYTDPLELFTYMNTVGKKHGVGRIDMVENRFIGIKSRGIYETPAGTILFNALRDLEGIAMDKEVMRLRNMLAPEFASIIYNGFWFSPEMDFIMAAIEKSQEFISGKVLIQLYKGNARPVGRESPRSLYDQELSSMDIAGGFDQADSFGFIRVNSLRLKAHRAIIDR